MKADEFDEIFDDGEDISSYVDMSTVQRPGLEPKRVNVDFPRWIVDSLDQQAKLLGVTRQAVIKLWIAERLKLETRPVG
jgi:hypothetical protein